MRQLSPDQLDENTPFCLSRRGASGIGVQTLAQIQAGAGAGRVWADYANPNEFQVQGAQVRKRPLYHADPWVLDNLNRLRGELYDGGGLEDLLRVSADVPLADRRVLYEGSRPDPQTSGPGTS